MKQNEGKNWKNCKITIIMQQTWLSHVCTYNLHCGIILELRTLPQVYILLRTVFK